MITNEQRAHDIALTLLQSRAKDLSQSKRIMNMLIHYYQS